MPDQAPPTVGGAIEQIADGPVPPPSSPRATLSPSEYDNEVVRRRFVTLTRLMRNPSAVVGGLLLLIFVAIAVFAPLLAPYGPREGGLAQRLQSPSFQHLFGTDLQGRDVFSRVLLGARVSLEVALSSIAIAGTVGVAVGAVAGFLGGVIDSVVMRVVDVFLAIPGILLAIGVVAWLGQGIPQITMAIAIGNMPTLARLARGSVLEERNKDYVAAARSTGVSEVRLLVRHVLPNAISPVIVQATLLLGTAIVTVAGLGFLGLGPTDPSTPEWGTMLTDSLRYLRDSPNLVFFPSLAIVLTVLAFNLFGDGLREVLDPRRRR